MFQLHQINSSWSLFLDRDGVINRDKVGDYICNVGEFRFYEGALESIRYFSTVFNRILVITNQKGVAKGLMTEADLATIHRYMIGEIEKAGGRIDRIYYSVAPNNDDPRRKPNPGMAWDAKADFPEIDLGRTIMVGNNLSDMEFGRNAGTRTVFIRSTLPDFSLPHPAVDLSFPDLASFAKALQER